MKKVKAFKFMIVLLMTLIITVSVAFVISADTDVSADTELIKMQDYYVYDFHPDGYIIQYGEKVNFSGTYVLIGEPTSTIYFESDEGSPVTYNVILHALNAEAESWSNLFVLDYGVTLNLTVYGDNVINGYSSPAIITGQERLGLDPPKVNIKLTDGSRLTIGYANSEGENRECIDKDIAVSVEDGVTASLDITEDGWHFNEKIVFTKGDAVIPHNDVFTYYDESYCIYECEYCDILGHDKHEHTKYGYALEEGHEDYGTKHRSVCYSCNHEFSMEDHEIEYTFNEDSHTAVCYSCYYEGEEEAHTLDENGCSVCKAKYSVSYTTGDQTIKKIELDSVLNSLSLYGGKITLLNDVESYYGAISSETNDIIIDLAGKKLSGYAITAGDGTTVTVVDSSAEKSGEINSFMDFHFVYGTLHLDGITIRDDGINVCDGSYLLIEDCVIKDSTAIYTDKGKTEIINVRSEDKFIIDLSDTLENVDCTIISGSFAELMITSNADEKLSAGDFIPDGYAFYDKDGLLIDSSSSFITGVAEIAAHTVHNSDNYHFDSGEHWLACTCGKNESADRRPHTLGADGKCETCKNVIISELTVGDKTTYHTDVDGAFANLGSDTGEVKLLADANIFYVRVIGKATLDLNGYTLGIDTDRMYVSGELTINDTSENKTGAIEHSRDWSYIIQAHKSGKLTINGGEFFGLIYLTDDGTSVEINGGRFLGKEKFRISSGTTVTVNGGVFECSKVVFDLTWSSGDEACFINGGVFINSTLFSVYDIAEANITLGSDGECELAFLDVSGSELTYEALTNYHDGEIIVAHKNSVLNKDTEHHWLSCDCGDHTKKIAHTVVYNKSESDDSVHNVTCKSCEYVIAAESHTGGNATCESKAVCDMCKEVYGTTSDHIYDNSCDSVCNVCPHTRVVSGHVYDNDCDASCNACETVRDTSDHNYVDGECTSCGSPSSESGSSSSSGMSEKDDDVIEKNDGNADEDHGGIGAWGIVGIIAGSVAVALGIGAAVIFFVKKRRIK